MNTEHNFTIGAAINKPLPRLTYIELEAIVPAAFAESPSPRTSDNYRFISTKHILDDLNERGYYPVRATQPESKDPYCIHSITLRRTGGDLVVGDVVPEVMLTNSHNALRSFSITAGLYRLACSNGLLISFSAFSLKAKQRHLGRNHLDDQLNYALENVDEGLKYLPQMRERQLNEKEQLDFSYEAAFIRENGHPGLAKQYDLRALLKVRREEDLAPTLWSTYNRLQENILKGGVAGRIRELKPITQVDRSAKINKQLWETALTFLN